MWKSFSAAAFGKSLKPVFDLFLRTTNKLDVQIRQTDTETFNIRLVNAGMPLPVDISTDKGLERLIVDEKGLVLKSKTLPVVDPKGYYLKKVTID